MFWTHSLAKLCPKREWQTSFIPIHFTVLSFSILFKLALSLRKTKKGVETVGAYVQVWLQHQHKWKAGPEIFPQLNLWQDNLSLIVLCQLNLLPLFLHNQCSLIKRHSGPAGVFPSASNFNIPHSLRIMSQSHTQKWHHSLPLTFWISQLL